MLFATIRSLKGLEADAVQLLLGERPGAARAAPLPEDVRDAAAEVWQVF